MKFSGLLPALVLVFSQAAFGGATAQMTVKEYYSMADSFKSFCLNIESRKYLKSGEVEDSLFRQKAEDIVLKVVGEKLAEEIKISIWRPEERCPLLPFKFDSRESLKSFFPFLPVKIFHRTVNQGKDSAWVEDSALFICTFMTTYGRILRDFSIKGGLYKIFGKTNSFYSPDAVSNSLKNSLPAPEMHQFYSLEFPNTGKIRYCLKRINGAWRIVRVEFTGNSLVLIYPCEAVFPIFPK